MRIVPLRLLACSAWWLCACGGSSPPPSKPSPAAAPDAQPAAPTEPTPTGWYCYDTDVYSACERTEAECKEVWKTLGSSAWWTCAPATSAWCMTYVDPVLEETMQSCSSWIEQCESNREHYAEVDSAGSPRSVPGSITACQQVP